MSTAPAPAPAPTEGFVPVALRDVEKELTRQLKAEQDPGGPPVQWARMSNLVIYCDRPEAEASLTAEIGDIVRSHPARVLLLVARPGMEAGNVTAEVRLRTRYLPGKQEVGSEQITLRADGRAVERLPSIVRQLLIGDLPTNIWWASEQPPPTAGPLLYELAEHAQQVVYDSLGWADPARGLLATASWLDRFERGAGEGRYRVASDLTWRRLRMWRRLVAQTFDPYSAPGLIESVNEVTIEHGLHSVMAAWSLASWMCMRLHWRVQGARITPGVEMHWHLASSRGVHHLRIRRLGDEPRGLRRVRLGCALGDWPWDMSIVPLDDEHLGVLSDESDTAARTVAVKPLSLADIVARQLSDRERDVVFRQSMIVAQDLAQGILR
jgi:glucose-6-phosphate dehydrogenase assembly protein OpcA